MPVRPIDLQVIIPKANSHPLNRENVVNKEANQLQQTQMLNKQEAVEKEKKVIKTDQKSDSKVDPKKEQEERKKQSAQSKKKDAKDAKDAKDETKEKSVEEVKKEADAKRKKTAGIPFHRFDMKV